jgi:hypothetical protein
MRGVWLAVFAVGCGEVKEQHDAGHDAVTVDAPIDMAMQVQHLYVADDSTPGHVFRYLLPLTTTSTPDATLAADSAFAVGTDTTGNVIVETQGGKMLVFAPTATTPFATFQNGTGTAGGQPAVTPGGVLIAPMQKPTLNRFSSPFTNATTPSGMVTSAALTNAIGVGIDSQANLYIANNVMGAANLVVFPAPYTASTVATPTVSGAAYRNVAVSGTKLFVGSVGNVARIDVYNLPLTATSAPAFAITAGTNVPEGVAVDAAGHLYAGNLTDNTVSRYSPPFSAQSAPDITITTQATIFGLAVGP